MVKCYFYFLRTITVFLIFCAVQRFDILNAVCTSDQQKKLKEAFAHNALSQLFFDEIERVYTDKAIENNELNYNDYYQLINLFDCSHALIQEDKNSFVTIQADAFIETSVKAQKFIKTFIEELFDVKRGKLSRVGLSNNFVKFIDYADKLKEFRKQALIDVLMHTYKSNEDSTTDFEKLYKSNNYQSFFDSYQRLFNESLPKKGQPKASNDAEQIAQIVKKSFRTLNNQDRKKSSSTNDSEVALAIFNYLQKFKAKVVPYIKELTSKIGKLSLLKRITRTTQKKDLARIEQLKGYSDLADTMLDAIFITNLYQRPPLEFAKKLEEASSAYRLILAETKSLIRLYARVQSYFLTVIKALSK